ALLRLANCLPPPTSWHRAWALVCLPLPIPSLFYPLGFSTTTAIHIAQAHHVACDDDSLSVGRTVLGQCATHVL
ncbi:hypothetical protein C8F04DRAFT_1116007, partial [Mycena alexandri]